MAFSGMLNHVALVRTDVSEELSASFIRVTRIGVLGTTLAVTSNRRKLQRMIFLRSVRRLLITASVVPSSQILVTLMKEALSSSETLCLQEPHDVTSQKMPFFITALTLAGCYVTLLQPMCTTLYNTNSIHHYHRCHHHHYYWHRSRKLSPSLRKS
jgi:hypothetical protein